MELFPSANIVAQKVCLTILRRQTAALVSATRVAKCCSVEVSLNAKQKVAGLKVVSRLNAADEFGEAAIKIVVRDIQATVGPGAAEIRAHVKS